MKTITLQLYTFDELSDEVQKEIIERERWNIMEQCMEGYGSDYVTSLRAFEKLTNTDEISYNDSVEEEDCWCNICEKHVELCTLSELWEMFGDIPVNNDDEIEKEFLNFPAGTSKLDVWHWFDERCPNNLHDDLMFSQNDAVQI